jgi:hypothetical protein
MVAGLVVRSLSQLTRVRRAVCPGQRGDPTVLPRLAELLIVGEQIGAVPGEPCRGDGVVAVAAGDQLVTADTAERRPSPSKSP